MTEIQIFSDVEVKLVKSLGGDEDVVQAARVSVVGENAPVDAEKDEGLIKYLLREKHGSPFEHNSMTFFVKAPIFVFREFHRHRVGWSYNEMSGRYTKLPPEFYVPGPERPLVLVGKASKPVFAAGNYSQKARVGASLTRIYGEAWVEYQSMLNAGIAPEVARLVLPVGIFSQMYATANARSIMNFLSLRTQEATAAHVSRPQIEIEMVARKIEEAFAEKFPITYKYFNEFGRVAP